GVRFGEMGFDRAPSAPACSMVHLAVSRILRSPHRPFLLVAAEPQFAVGGARSIRKPGPAGRRCAGTRLWGWIQRAQLLLAPIEEGHRLRFRPDRHRDRST